MDGEEGRGGEGGKEGGFRRRRSVCLMDLMMTCHQTLCRTRRGPTPKLTIRTSRRAAFTLSRTKKSEVQTEVNHKNITI